MPLAKWSCVIFRRYFYVYILLYLHLCVAHIYIDSNPVTRGDPENGGLLLTDPCIENPGNVSILPSPPCGETVISDYDQDWINVGYNDSNWQYASTYTTEESVPRGGRPPRLDSYANCSNTQWYCDYEEESWQDSQFIWSSSLTLDNVVLCRYEYQSDCGDHSRPRWRSSDSSN